MGEKLWCLAIGVVCFLGFVGALQAVIVGDVKYGALGGYGVGFISAALLGSAAVFFWMAVRG